MIRIFLALIFLGHSLQLFSAKMPEGTYRGALIINSESNLEIPFNFDVKYKRGKLQITIRNGDEKILVDKITCKGDSVNFRMPVFDTEFRTVKVKNDLEGVWINHSSSYRMRFRATFGEAKRFLYANGKPDPVFEGRWKTLFSPGTSDSSRAIGVFHHVEQTDDMTGTFLTETGDYRYLEGQKSGNKLYLSTFDGSHAYLFVAQLDENKRLNGIFYSGAKWKESWIAEKDGAFKLNDAEEITFLKNKDARLAFSFPRLDGKTVSLNDQKFDGKPVIIQVMGSWCPNCMDESRYLSELYRQYHSRDLEIIALAFEKTDDFEKAKQRLLHMKERVKMDYDILITQQTGREKASETLNALNGISAFPTTIFLNRRHEVVKVHTGFSGPATGNEYTIFAQRTDALIQELIKK